MWEAVLSSYVWKLANDAVSTVKLLCHGHAWASTSQLALSRQQPPNKHEPHWPLATFHETWLGGQTLTQKILNPTNSCTSAIFDICTINTPYEA